MQECIIQLLQVDPLPVCMNSCANGMLKLVTKMHEGRTFRKLTSLLNYHSTYTSKSWLHCSVACAILGFPNVFITIAAYAQHGFLSVCLSVCKCSNLLLRCVFVSRNTSGDADQIFCVVFSGKAVLQNYRACSAMFVYK